MTSATRAAQALVVIGMTSGGLIQAQSAGPTQGQPATDTRTTTFEVVSIRRSDLSTLPAGLEGEDPCSQAMPRRSGNRLVASTTTVYALIALAYNPWKLQCARARTANLIVGGPDWIRTERYSIEALLPDGVDAPSDERLF